MKTLLAPTDFSVISLNALDYAVELAKLTDAKLVIFHAFHAPLIISEVPVVMPLPEELEKDSLKQLKKIEKNLQHKHGGKLKIEIGCACGLAVDEIVSYTEKAGVDMIVIGMHGAGFLEEKLVGSVTTSLIQRSKIPVLSIDTTTLFRKIKSMVFASDYHEIKKLNFLKPLIDLAHLFKAHVHILNVAIGENTEPTLSQAAEGIKLEHMLEATNHSFHQIKNKSVVDGINLFVKAHHIDMVVMIPRKHSFFNSLVKESDTKKMAFHASAPLLTIHE